MCSWTLIFLRLAKPAALIASFQQRRVLAGQAVALAERVEGIFELVLVDQRRERADLFEPIGGRHQDAGFGAQPATIIDARSCVTMRTPDATRSLSQR